LLLSSCRIEVRGRPTGGIVSNPPEKFGALPIVTSLIECIAHRSEHMQDQTIRVGLSDIPSGDRNARQAAFDRLKQYNNLPFDALEERRALLTEIFAEAVDVMVNPPLISGGKNVRLGRHVFVNSNVAFGGVAPITIGAYCLISQNVQLLTITHPVDPTERQQWAYWAKPITIGENVWIGANAIVCAGVTIGDHSVIGAGSVVTRDIPACVLAAGNPCRVIRELKAPDMATLYQTHLAAKRGKP
jgi:acetyltransferase-like isoleucine patch superfamily enzyme